MAAPKFTRGPWKLNYENETGSGDEGFSQWYTAGPAEVHYGRWDQAEARQALVNAQLIVAAPDLYHALRRLRESHECPMGAECDCEVVSNADAVLAQARGES